MQDELDRLAALLGRSVTVDGPTGRLLGHSVQSDDVDAARISTILARQVPDDVRAWQDRHEVGSATGPLRVPANAELRMSARLCLPLRKRNVLRAHLWVVEGERALTAEEVQQVVRAGERLLDALPAASAYDAVPALLERLVAPAPVAEAERVLGSLAASVPALLGGTVRFVVGVRPESRPPAAWVRRIAALARPDGGVVATTVGPARATVLWLEPRTAPGPTTGTVRDLLASAAYAVGTGPAVPFEAAPLLRGLEQAVLTATVAAADPRVGPDAAWERIGLYQHFLDRSTLDGRAAALAPLSEDEPGAVLLDTLETYLDLAGDAQRTAAALSLHRTTLYYRLNRAATLLDGDLGDGLWRSSLHLSLKARRLSRARTDAISP